MTIFARKSSASLPNVVAVTLIVWSTAIASMINALSPSAFSTYNIIIYSRTIKLSKYNFKKNKLKAFVNSI